MKKLTLLFVALMSVMSMFAVDYYYRGEKNNWNATKMTLSDDSYYSYYEFTGANQFKISKSNTTYDYGCKYVQKNYNGTDISDIGDWGGDNCYTWYTNKGYIIVYHPNTEKNATNSPIICASTTLPNNSSKPKYYITGSSNLVGGDGWKANEIEMTENNGTYTYTFNNLQSGTYEFKITNGSWSISKGHSDLSDAYQNVTNNSDNNVILNLEKTTTITITFDGSKISLNLPQKRYTVYFVNDKSWTSVNVYLWNDNNENNTWPGKAMTKIEGKTYKSKDVYEYTFHPKFTKIIFNNGSNKTSDLTVTEGKLYYYDSKWNETINYDVTISVIAGEGGTVSGGGTYNYGATPTLTAKANSGYEFVEWQQNGTRVSTANPYTTPKVTSEATYTAIFKYKDVTFTDPSTLEFATYGQLTYQLPMPNNQWYWISLPFDVNVAEITVDGATNGVKNSDALVITEYNAVTRAAGEKGWTNINSSILEANKGYVMGPTDGAHNANMVVNFPSASPTNKVNSSAKDTLTSTGGNTQNDNWYIIGTGLYHQGSLSNINYVAMPAKNDKGKDTYEYKYISSGNELFTEKLGTNSFAPFTAFFVQYGGDYSATADNAQSATLAPVARAKAQQNEQIYCLNMNETHTVVILNAEGSEGYTVGQDFLEMNASNHSDLIYSFDGSDALAFNHRATEAQSIALGGYVATAGEQTISLKGYNANVESVTLVDNVTGETIELLAGDYTFNAEVGSLDGRFIVVFGAPKAGDTTVDCYNSTANQLIAYGSANACTVSGLTTGEAIAIYNTMGQLVFATIADSETITLPSLTTGNYLILHNGTTNKVLLK